MTRMILGLCARTDGWERMEMRFSRYLSIETSCLLAPPSLAESFAPKKRDLKRVNRGGLCGGGGGIY